MKTHLVRIGNSRGVRLPKAIITQAGLMEDIDLVVRNGTIVIAPSRSARSGWARAARQMRKRDDDLLLDPPVPTLFDEKEWEW